MEAYMAKRKNIVIEFNRMKRELCQKFACEDDVFFKPLLKNEFAIQEDGGFYFLTYWKEDGTKIQAVIVKKDGVPLISLWNGYKMIVAIDCVKIGFIFEIKNEKREDSIL